MVALSFFKDSNMAIVEDFYVFSHNDEYFAIEVKNLCININSIRCERFVKLPHDVPAKKQDEPLILPEGIPLVLSADVRLEFIGKQSFVKLVRDVKAHSYFKLSGKNDGTYIPDDVATFFSSHLGVEVLSIVQSKSNEYSFSYQIKKNQTILIARYWCNKYMVYHKGFPSMIYSEDKDALGDIKVDDYKGTIYRMYMGSKSGCVRNAYGDLKKEADEGNYKAQYYMGEIYRKGEGPMVKDLNIAKKWYEKAAVQGCVDSKQRLKSI